MAKKTPIKAIRAKCIECCNGQQKEVRECAIASCPLHEYRMGHRPKGEEVPLKTVKSKKRQLGGYLFG